MSITMHCLWPNRRLLFFKHIEDVCPLMYPTRNEAAEQGDIRIRHMVIPNAAVSSIPNVIFCQQVLLIHFPLGSIGGGSFSCSPILGQMEPIVCLCDTTDSLVQLLFGNMMLIDPGQIAALYSRQ